MSDFLRQFTSSLQDPNQAAAAPAATPAKPSINVSAKDTGSAGEFTVTGSGFSANANVFIRVVDDALKQIGFSQSADGSGGLKAVLTFPCIGGLTLHFSATDNTPDSSDLTGVLWSNTFNIPCPCAPPDPSKGDNGDQGDDGDGSDGGGDSSGGGGSSGGGSDSSGSGDTSGGADDSSSGDNSSGGG